MIVAGENDNPERARNATQFLVADEQWRAFCDSYKHLLCYVPDGNKSMASSYLALDQYIRSVGNGEGMITTSELILEVGVVAAVRQVR